MIVQVALTIQVDKYRTLAFDGRHRCGASLAPSVREQLTLLTFNTSALIDARRTAFNSTQIAARHFGMRVALPRDQSAQLEH
jgi:hypothetical protein